MGKQTDGQMSPETSISEDVRMKLEETDVPGWAVTCSPEESEIAGAFVEDALSAKDAIESIDGFDYTESGGKGL